MPTRFHALQLAAAIVMTSVAAVPSNAQVVFDDCETEATITYGALALKLAPVYWFSPDEPLLGPSRSIVANPLPHPLPPVARGAGSWPGPAPIGAVYYRVSSLRLAPRADTPAARDRLRLQPGIGAATIPLETLSRVEFRMFSYYDEDVGFGAHPDDLEVVDIALDVHAGRRFDSSPCHRLQIARLASTAHGSDWYTNTLEVDHHVDDLVMPLHVLVEEGKHAMVPDRNADGSYSPGYDVNRAMSDAWGVRDTLRNRRQGGVSYHSEGAKDRASHPVKSVPFGGPKRLRMAAFGSRFQSMAKTLPSLGATMSTAGIETDTGEYLLTEAGTEGTADYCLADGGVSRRIKVGANEALYGYLRKWGFCAPTSVDGPRSPRAFLRSTGPTGPGNATRRDRLAMSWVNHARLDGGALTGISTNAFFGLRVPVVEGWLVPHVAYLWQAPWARTDFEKRRRLTLDIAYSPSGSRSFDWYVAAGAQRDWREDAAGWTFVQEGGIKVRVPFDRLAFLNSLTSLRLGYRGPVLQRGSDGHWVIQLGVGGW